MSDDGMPYRVRQPVVTAPSACKKRGGTAAVQLSRLDRGFRNRTTPVDRKKTPRPAPTLFEKSEISYIDFQFDTRVQTFENVDIFDMDDALVWFSDAKCAELDTKREQAQHLRVLALAGSQTCSFSNAKEMQCVL